MIPDGEDQTWIEIEGELFGACADDRGPIGGGPGYERIVTSGDRTARTVDELLNALSQANDGEVVFIPGDLAIDLTARIYVDELVLEVPAGVTLASDRGHNDSPGAEIASDALKTPVIIRPLGPCVRVTGLRLRGPNPKRYQEHHDRSFGPDGLGRDYYYRFPTSDCIKTEHRELEVDNCEISAFAHAGVFLMDGDGHHIHHNFIHHCQYQGLGYGVCHRTASSLIERNLFDWNRHSIAGSGHPACGYRARHNVELGTSLSHCFDMHGGRDRGDGTDIAGTSMEISNNTFRAPTRAVAIRGTPQEKCVVHHNWFVTHGSAAEAVRGSERLQVCDNAYGEEPVTK